MQQIDNDAIYQRSITSLSTSSSPDRITSYEHSLIQNNLRCQKINSVEAQVNPTVNTTNTMQYYGSTNTTSNITDTALF